MASPEKLRYSKEHEWIRVEANQGYLGITDHAQGELGEIVYVEVDTVGDEIAKDEMYGTVEAVKTTSDLFMPVSGKIVEFNPKLDETGGDNPGLINEDPYVEGWIVKIEILDATELDDLMSAEEYEQLIS